MGRVTGKTAIVTGAAQGMGLSHARRLVDEGANVALTDISTEKGERAARELGERAKFFAHDVTCAASWAELVKNVETAFGPIDVLVNNAGIGYLVPFDELDEEEFVKFIRVNQLGVFLGMKAVVPSMRKAGGGSIINISSTCGLRTLPNAIAYTATKFAVTGMSKAAAFDLGADNIRVNSLHPGLTRTPMLSKETEDKMSQRTPLNRIADAEEVSALLLFLASDESRYCTAAEFVIDGGLTAGH